MGGLRSKIVIALIFYFGGFGSAIYFLTPVSKDESPELKSESSAVDLSESGDLTESINNSLHKFVAFAKEAAVRTGALIQEKIEENKIDS